MRVSVVAIALMLAITALSLPGLSAAPAVDDAVQTRQVEGPAIPVPGDKEASVLDTARETVERFGLQPESNVVKISIDGTVYYVLTDTEPKAGIATVTGTVIEPVQVDGDRGYIVADSLEIDRSVDYQTGMSDVKEQPSRHTGNIVVVGGHFAQAAGILDTEGVHEIFTAGSVAHNGHGLQLSGLGQVARDSSVNLQNGETDVAANQQALSKYPESSTDQSTDYTAAYQVESWWLSTEAHVKLFIVPPELTGGDGPQLWPMSYTVAEAKTVTVEEIKQNGAELAGTVVRVDANSLGTRISTQEALLKVAKCAPESVTIPGAGCVPAVTDVTVHAGVLSDTEGTTVPYAGLSNQHQDTIAKPEKGEYRYVGRVVELQTIDKRLGEGYGLLVYDRKRLGGFKIAGNDAVKNRAENVATRLHSQIEMTEEEYASLSTTTSAGTGTASPTSGNGDTAVGTEATNETSNGMIPSETDGFGIPAVLAAALAVALLVRRNSD